MIVGIFFFRFVRRMRFTGIVVGFVWLVLCILFWVCFVIGGGGIYFGLGAGVWLRFLISCCFILRLVFSR